MVGGMHFSIFFSVIGLLVNTINFAFDRGANMRGSDRAPGVIAKDLSFLNIFKNYTITSERNHLRTVLGDGYFRIWNTLDCNVFPLIIGGDHTISTSSIATCNDYCLMKRERLGVLWFSAFADFNTIESSMTGNLHGVPVSVLCGHTLPMIGFGKPLQTEQFGFYGLRDMDSLEFKRFTDYNMCILDTNKNLEEWCKNYDKIYLSFSLDVIDPTEFNFVNTPIPNGKTIDELKIVFTHIKNTGKLYGMDIVEYNPNKGENNTVIIDLIKTILC